MSEERIDKMIALCSGLSRSDVKKLIHSGEITVMGKVINDGSYKIPDDCQSVIVSGVPLRMQRHVYIMLNKPEGVVSASEGRGDTTVIDILPEEYKRRGLFPAGRLDRDTVGFCLITDDGDFAHRILSPKSHVPKTYLTRIDRCIDVEDAVKRFAEGMELSGEKLMPASLSLMQEGDMPLFEVVLREGRYHQIKLMFSKLGANVIELERIKIGNLYLDASLTRGECRYITDAELSSITK